MGFTPQKAEQSVEGMELQGMKEGKYEKHLGKLVKNASDLTLKAFRA